MAGRWIGIGALFGLFAAAPAFAQTVEIKEARVWMDEPSMKRMGLTPRGSAVITDGKVASAACDTIVVGTKYGRVLWGMKGKAHDFSLRAPVVIGEEKKTIAGSVSVDATGKATVTKCELVAYEPAQDDPPEWPADAP
jgi:hypothetical protein